MNEMSLPSVAQQREIALAELRVERRKLQLIMSQIDFIGTGVAAGFFPPDSVPLMLAELYGTTGEPAR